MYAPKNPDVYLIVVDFKEYFSNTYTQRKNMTKSPYELRFDLLCFARDTLTAQYYAMVEEVKSFPNRIRGEMPKYPTNDDVFKLAEEYKSFIERK